MARRLLAQDGELLLAEDENDTRMTARTLVCEQVRRTWEELTAQRLKMDEKVAADYMARTLTSTNQIDEGRVAWHLLWTSCEWLTTYEP